MDDEFDYYLSSATLRFIRFKARQLAGRYGFRHDESEDIQQTLIAHCLERAARFNSRRSQAQTFTRIVIDRQIATMVGFQRARCRDYRLCQRSSDSPRGGADCVTVVRHVEPDAGEFELRSDVARVLDRLDVADRRVALFDPAPAKNITEWFERGHSEVELIEKVERGLVTR